MITTVYIDPHGGLRLHSAPMRATHAHVTEAVKRIALRGREVVYNRRRADTSFTVSGAILWPISAVAVCVVVDENQDNRVRNQCVVCYENSKGGKDCA